MAAPLVAAAAKGLAKKAASSAAKGAAKKAASSDSGKKAMKLGCLAIMALVAVPVFIFLALVSPIIGAFQSNQNIGCQGQTAPPPDDATIALGAIKDAGVTDDNKATVMVAIAGAASNFDHNATGGLWGITQAAYPAGYPPQATADPSVTPPDNPNWINDPGNAATAAIAVAGGAGITTLSYWANNSAYQAFASAGGVTTTKGVTTFNWSVASTVSDSGGYFSQATSALSQLKSDPNGTSCQCAGGSGGTGGGPGGALSGQQTAYVQQIIGIAKTMNLSQSAQIIGIMVALDESGIKQYANSNVPASLNYPHEAVGSDHGSVGIFQQQVNPDGSNFGWGTLAQLMNPTNGTAYQAYRFFNALEGVGGWQTMQPWVAAQAVQHSGTSSGANYQAFLNQATSVVTANASAPAVPLPAGATPGNPGGAGGATCTAAGGVGGCLNPIHAGWYGPARTDQGVDWLPNAANTPVLAICPGVVTYVANGGIGWPGFGTETQGGFMDYKITSGSKAGHCIYVAENLTNMVPVGTVVTAGQQIALSQPGYAWTEWGWAQCNGSGYGGPATPGGGATPGGMAFARFLNELGAHCQMDPGPGPDVA